VVRGGYGQFYNRESFDAIGFRQLSSNPPFAQEVTVNQTTLTSPGGGTVLTHPPSLNTANMDVLPQYYQEWNLSLQRSVWGSAVWDVSYVGNKGTHLARIDNINQLAPNILVASGKVNVDTVRPYLGYGAITYVDLTGKSIYHGLQTSLSQNSHKGLTLQVSYTFSKVLTDSDTSVYAPDRRLEWAPADIYVKHNFVTTIAYQLPFFKSQSGLTRRILAGWQVSGIYLVQSGKPTDVTIKSDIAGLGTTTQRPQITCNPNLSHGQKTPAAYFNTSCFTTPLLGTLATTSARPLISPGVNNFNFSLLKRVNIDEKRSLEFQGDLYNALNHTQFTTVGSTFGTSTFGVITATGASRETQLGVKFRW
jgi:hypothetical protein